MSPDELKAKQESYAEDGGAHCPFCASPDMAVFNYRRSFTAPGVLLADAHCAGCGKAWRTRFVLAGFEM